VELNRSHDFQTQPGRQRPGRFGLQAALCAVVLVSLVLSGCVMPDTAMPAPSEPVGPAVSITATQLEPGPCSDTFVRHVMDFATNVDEWPVRMFSSNGSGLAVNDLDNDGLLDVVMANLDGQNAIFWNRGRMEFERADMETRNTRAVSIVDVDGDGWHDIVFALRRYIPVAWLNREGPDGGRTFESLPLSLFKNRSYTQAWADLDQDGDLDAVTVTYDAEPMKEENQPAPTGGGGVFVMYQNNDGSLRFEREQLAIKAQGLALLLLDLNDDGRQDILVGHDFELPDQTWVRTDDGWEETTPFSAVARNTMGFAAAEPGSDGVTHVFAADMMPFFTDEETMAQWAPLMEDMHFEVAGNQVMRNVLQVETGDGGYTEMAEAAQLQATGWSWSSQYGDLDLNGYMDLYVVNGMHSEEMFSHLPDSELVEENLVFRYTGDGYVWEPDWGLNATEGGRGMMMADLDNDGDLDIVVNNLIKPSVMFENQLCTEGQSLQVDLRWPGSGNTRAIGAELTVWSGSDSYSRTIRSNSGYLSGEPSRVHFGLPSGASMDRLEIRWPDGEMSEVGGLEGGSLLTVTRE